MQELHPSQSPHSLPICLLEKEETKQTNPILNNNGTCEKRTRKKKVVRARLPEHLACVPRLHRLNNFICPCMTLTSTMAFNLAEFDVLLLDIEGTVCPISFVKDVLVSS
jgi:hypothetical protein